MLKLLYVAIAAAFVHHGVCHTTYPVVISRGAFISSLEAVVVYNDIELIHHIIGDIPEPPTPIAQVCPAGATKRACKISKHLSAMVEDSTALLTVLNKARTTYGLKDEELPNVFLQQDRFVPVVEEEVKVDPPGDDMVKIVGREWYNQVKERLLNRRPHMNGTQLSHHIVRRWIQEIKPLVIGGAAILGLDDLLDYAGSLFVGENGILRFLTTLHALSPDKSMVDLSNKVSEFEAKSRQITADLALDTAQLKFVTDDLQNEVMNHKTDMATIEDSHIISQQIVGDLSKVMFTQMVYFSYMIADNSCRGGYLSPLLIPPSLLAEKLIEVAKIIPHDMKLAMGLDELQKYYTRKSTSCIYDSHGGLITVHVPLVYKNVDLQLFEYRNIFFAWEHLTCTLESASRFVVKDIKGNKVYPIEDVDEESCSPHIVGKCKVPPMSDSSEAYCLNQLMSSSTIAQVREACKMSCFEKNTTLLTEMQPNVFIGVHIQQNSLKVYCPNHDVYNITEKVIYGSLRVITRCACSFILFGKTIARSGGPPCEGHETISIDILLPAHWTTLTDLLPFSSDGKDDVTKFEHMAEIFDPHYMDAPKQPSSFITAEISILAIVWNMLHSFMIAYVLFRMHVATAGAVVHLSTYQLAEAAHQHFCKLDDDLFYLLCAILALCSLAFIPPLLRRFYLFLKGQFWDAVEVAADKRLSTI